MEGHPAAHPGTGPALGKMDPLHGEVQPPGQHRHQQLRQQIRGDHAGQHHHGEPAGCAAHRAPVLGRARPDVEDGGPGGLALQPDPRRQQRLRTAPRGRLPAHRQDRPSRRIRRVLLDHAAVADPADFAHQSAAESAYTNPIGTKDGTATYAIRTAPLPEYSVGKAQVDINGTIELSPNAQSGHSVGLQPLGRQPRAGVAFHLRARDPAQHGPAAELHRRSRQQPRTARGAQRPGGPVQLRGANRPGGSRQPRPDARQQGLELEHWRGRARSATRTRTPRRCSSSGAIRAASPSSGSTRSRAR